MIFGPARRAAIFVPLALALAGCQELQSTNTPADGTESLLGQSEVRTEIRETERPDIFSTSENALWDGRPSLGGVWVAHPDVSDPERAKITNTKTGQSVSGALFRRERANPGPRIQVSSDAAAALGMLAGQPTELSIVVIRQEEIEIAPESLPLSDEGAPTDAPSTEAEEPSGENDVAAVAGAALAVETLDEPRQPGFWGRFRNSLRNKPAGDIATEADTALIEDITESAEVPVVETAPLDTVASGAAAAIAAAEAPTREPEPASSSVRNPFIQVGLFSEEENASSAAANLRQAGIVPTVEEQTTDNKTFWRVFVGPVQSADDQAAILAQVAKLGFKDAFLAPN